MLQLLLVRLQQFVDGALVIQCDVVFFLGSVFFLLHELLLQRGNLVESGLFSLEAGLLDLCVEGLHGLPFGGSPIRLEVRRLDVNR